MAKERIVYVQGTWDLFHVGHINILWKARNIAKKLIVGVNTDESVKNYKGNYPAISFFDRVTILEACRFVDGVLESDLTFDIKVLKKYKVEVIVLGSDWKNKYLEGLEWMKTNGKKVVYLPYTQGISSSIIKD